jgi:hypothetical protein
VHGSVLHGFKQFVTARDGQSGWEATSKAASADAWYASTQVYPDDVLYALVAAAASRWSQSPALVLEDFGAALVPTLLQLYGSFIVPHWRTVDLLNNAELIMHRTVRIRDPLASPPLLRSRRVSSTEVHIDYTSVRKLCSLALGICRGVASHYAERVSIEQPVCMNRGDRACQLVVRVL